MQFDLNPEILKSVTPLRCNLSSTYLIMASELLEIASEIEY
jgi:hypothetical protein